MTTANRKREQEEVTFSRRAAAVLHSPYFYVTPAFPTLKATIQHDRARRKEMRRLQAALDRADVYAELPADARKVFDAAEKAIRDYRNSEEALDRMGQIPNLRVGNPATLQNRKPDQRTGLILAMAITQAMEQGDRKTANYLAALAKTPEKVHELVGDEEITVENLLSTARQAPQVKPSPFRRKR